MCLILNPPPPPPEMDKRENLEGGTKLPDAEGLWPGCGILLSVLPTLRTVKRSLQQTPIKGRAVQFMWRGRRAAGGGRRAGASQLLA